MSYLLALIGMCYSHRCNTDFVQADCYMILAYMHNSLIDLSYSDTILDYMLNMLIDLHYSDNIRYYTQYNSLILILTNTYLADTLHSMYYSFHSDDILSHI